MGVKIGVLVLLALFCSLQAEARRPTRVGYMAFEYIFPNKPIEHVELNPDIEREQDRFYPKLLDEMYEYQDYKKPENQNELTCASKVMEVVAKLSARNKPNNISSLSSEGIRFSHFARATYERAYHFSRTSKTLLKRAEVAKPILFQDNSDRLEAEKKVAYMKMMVENIRDRVDELRDILGNNEPSHLLSRLLEVSMATPLPSMSNCTADIIFSLNCVTEIFNNNFKSNYETLMNDLKEYEEHKALRTDFQSNADYNTVLGYLDDFNDLLAVVKDNLLFNKGGDYIWKMGSEFFGYLASQTSNKLSRVVTHFNSKEQKWCSNVGTLVYGFQQ